MLSQRSETPAALPDVDLFVLLIKFLLSRYVYVLTKYVFKEVYSDPPPTYQRDEKERLVGELRDTQTIIKEVLCPAPPPPRFRAAVPCSILCTDLGRWKGVRAEACTSLFEV